MPSTPTIKPRRCVLVFARSPVLGTVKTRLAAHLAPDTVLGLYRCFVEDTLDTLQYCDTDVAVHFHPPEAEAAMRRWLGDALFFAPQRGDSLGARMLNAFEWAFGNGYDQAVCIGTDIPDICPAIVTEAFAAVDRAVCPLGPAADGGYYLIGFAAGRMPPGVFSDDIAWGTQGVFAATVDCLAAAGLGVAPLPTLQDIDTIADLNAFCENTRRDKHWARRAVAFMAAQGLGEETDPAADTRNND